MAAAIRIIAASGPGCRSWRCSQHLKPARIVGAVIRPHRQFGVPLEIDGRTPRLRRILVRPPPHRAVELHQVAPRLAVPADRQRMEPEVPDADMAVLSHSLDRAQWRHASGRVARLPVQRRHQLGDVVVALVHLGDPPPLLPLKTSEIKFFLVDKSTGIIAEPVGLRDAPRIFGAAVEQQYLKRYIEAREVRPAIPAVCPGGALRRSAAHSAGEIAKNDPNGMAGACALLSGGLRQHQRHGVADGSPGRPDLGAVA